MAKITEEMSAEVGYGCGIPEEITQRFACALGVSARALRSDIVEAVLTSEAYMLYKLRLATELPWFVRRWEA